MPHSLPLNAQGFIVSRDARAQGRYGELRAAVERGDLERARRGVYRAPCLPPEDPSTGRIDEARDAYLSDIRAVAHTFSAPVFTSCSAAALYGLPIIGNWPSDVYLLAKGGNGRRRSGVIEVARTRPVDLIELDGFAVTSVEFSLLQLARHAPLIAALTATDAALHVPRFGRNEPLTTIDRLRTEHERLKPYPRSRRAEAVLERATHLADTPIETGSRLLIEELGFAAPELQHELWLPELGRRAFLDFHWPDVRVGAEADGRIKYGEDQRRAVDAVIREKNRENAVRRQLQGFDRWDWNEMIAKHPVEQRLLRLGVPRVKRRTVLI